MKKKVQGGGSGYQLGGTPLDRSEPLMKDDRATEKLALVDEDGGESDLPHGHGLWSPGCRGWMARGSGPMGSVGLPLDLA